MSGRAPSHTRLAALRIAPLGIRAKIFAAFAVIALIIGAVGLYAAMGMGEAGRMVVRTFDMPLMAINHARLARSHFADSRYLMLRRQSAASTSEMEPLARAIKERIAELKQDLDIARSRSLSPEGRDAALGLQRSISAWYDAYDAAAGRGRAAQAELDAAAEQIERDFTALVNISAGDAFHWRQIAIATTLTNERVQIIAVVAALVLALGITLLLARQIVRPIEAASTAAARIAGGELETPIPKAGHDETGALLAAMAVMQDNLRATMASEVAEKRSAQRRLVDAIETVREGIVLIGTDGIVLMANTEALRMFPGAATCLEPGRPFRDFLERTRASDTAPAGRDGSRLEAADGEIKLADGRWISASQTVVGDGGAVVIWTDISLLKEREANLTAAKEKAEAADTAKTHFLANMSHELRTPLNAVIGFSEMIAHETLGPVGTPQYKGYAADIVGSGQHLLAIINDILDIAKSEAGTLRIDPKPVPVATLFDECAAIVRIGCEKAKLSFEVRSPPRSLAIQVDPVKTRQILLNLLSNAMKFTPAGGVVTLSADEEHPDFVDLVVADTGIGMRAEDIPVALSPFGQVDSRLARKYEGTGLGLPLTKILTELHGGELSMESKPAAGTVVRVRLPRRARAVARSALPAPARRAA